MIKVLIIEDSRVAQEFLVHILSSDPDLKVVGIANDGADALAKVIETRPDVVTMDINMPKLNGYEATRAIMESAPTRIVIVSAITTARDADSIFRAHEAGALAVVLRPAGIGHPDHKAGVKDLIQTIKMMSEIKVVRRINRAKKDPVATAASALSPTPSAAANSITLVPVPEGIQLVAIGASTGGPPVLHKILSGLPADLSVPILIVQHISPGFVLGFVEWLSAAAHFPVHIAEHNQQPLPGHAYVAPDGYHMGIAAGPKIILSNHEFENRLRPSVAYLFRTVAKVLGKHAMGILLTGMGRDGADDLKVLKDTGAITIAQDEASSIVHGMPGEAIKIGAANHILNPEEIAVMLSGLVKISTVRLQ